MILNTQHEQGFTNTIDHYLLHTQNVRFNPGRCTVAMIDTESNIVRYTFSWGNRAANILVRCIWLQLLPFAIEVNNRKPPKGFPYCA